VGKVVMYASVSVDGFIADEDDQPGPLFDWLLSGDVPLDESGVVKVSQASYDHTRPYWDQIGATVVLGSGKQYFGSVDAQHLLEDPDVVIRGERVLHMRYRVRR
jgi:hypothetical protein